jgi:heterodisulfide reductase subunit C
MLGGCAASRRAGLLFWALRSQMKMPKYAGAGIAHYGIFTGFAVLLLRTIILVGRAFDPHFNLWLLDPNGEMPWKLLGVGYALMKDAVVGMVLFGVLYFIKARLIDKQKRLAYGWHATVVLSVIATMMLTDMLYDGTLVAKAALAMPAAEGDLAARTITAAVHEASPLGFIVAKMLLGLGLTGEGALTALGMFGWWTHVALVFGFLNYLPYGKHFHVITALFNVLFRSMDAPGRLKPMAENSEKLMEIVGAAAELSNPTDAPVGVAQLEHFSWKSVLDFYTCTECGRCSDNCPAHRTGKLLSPKHFLLELRNHTYARQDEVMAREGGPRAGIAEFPPKPADAEGDAEAKPAAKKHADIKHVDLVPDVIDQDILWGCTTCRACEEQCPVLITYVDKIVDMRRNLDAREGRVSARAAEDVQRARDQRQPVEHHQAMDRGTWAEGLEIPLMRDEPNADVLYWVGCAASYDDRAKKIARATVKLMKAGGVKFAILGDEETCTGDPARRAGNEHLYMMLAEQNVATLNGYKPEEDRHDLPALLQHPAQRVPRPRRQVRGGPPHRLPPRAARRGEDHAHEARREGEGRLPRLVLPGPLQRGLRAAAARSSSASPASARRGRVEPREGPLLRRRRRADVDGGAAQRRAREQAPHAAAARTPARA